MIANSKINLQNLENNNFINPKLNLSTMIKEVLKRSSRWKYNGFKYETCCHSEKLQGVSIKKMVLAVFLMLGLGLPSIGNNVFADVKAAGPNDCNIGYNTGGKVGPDGQMVCLGGSVTLQNLQLPTGGDESMPIEYMWLFGKSLTPVYNSQIGTYPGDWNMPNHNGKTWFMISGTDAPSYEVAQEILELGAAEGGKLYFTRCAGRKGCYKPVRMPGEAQTFIYIKDAKVSARAQDATCENNAENGSVTATVNKGIAPFTYKLYRASDSALLDTKNSNSTNVTFNGLAVGFYYVSLVDGNGCKASTDKVEVTRPECCNVTKPGTIGADTVLCEAADFKGVYSITLPSGGVGAIEYMWLRSKTNTPVQNGGWEVIAGENGSSLSGNPSYLFPNSDTYFIRCSRRAGCDQYPGETKPVCIRVTPFSISAKGQALDCFGYLGTVVASLVEAGTDPVSYRWTNEAGDVVGTTARVTDLPAGTYYVAARDAKGCEDKAEAVISGPDPIEVVCATDSATCEGGLKDGVAKITAIYGGTEPYTILWCNGDTGYEADSLPANSSCSFTVTDANQCTFTKNVFVGGPEECCSLSVKVEDARLACYGDTKEVCATPLNGTGPYTYVWKDNGGNVVGNTACVTLGAGEYNVYVVDAKKCEAEGSFKITGPNAGLSLSVETEDATCDGEGKDGKATVSVTGGTPAYAYSWSNGQTTATATGLHYGVVYTVVVTDANGCKDSITAEVGKPKCCNVTDGGKIDGDTVLCVRADFQGVGNEVSPSGGIGDLEIMWFRFSKMGVNPNDWDLISGENGLSLPADPSYLYANNDTTYFIRCARRAGCAQFIESDTVCVMVAPFSIKVASTDVNCYGDSTGTVTATVVKPGTPGYTYEWKDAYGNVVGTTATVTGLPAGTYYVTAEDSKGCEDKGEVTISQPENLAVWCHVDSATCDGDLKDGVATIDSIKGGVAPYTVVWCNGDNGYVADSLAANSVCEALITDANGCTLYKKVAIPGPEVCCSLSVKVEDARLACYGDTKEVCATPLNGTGPYTYVWKDNSGNVVGNTACVTLGAGEYNVYVVDAKKCEAEGSLKITGPAAGLDLDVTTTNATCEGEGKDGTATVSVTGGTPAYTYSWSNGQTTAKATGLHYGVEYTVVVTDANGCKDSTTAKVGRPKCCNVTDGGKIDGDTVLCAREDFQGVGNEVSPSGGIGALEYMWFRFSKMGLNPQAWENIPNENGPSLPGNSSYLFANNDTTYFIRCVRRDSCAQFIESDTVCVMVAPFSIEVASTDVKCYGDSTGTVTATVVKPGTPGYTYEWKDAYGNVVGTTATVTGLPAGAYYVTAEDSKGCTDEGETSISQPDNLAVWCHVDSATCKGNLMDGVATIDSIKGGVAPYTVVWCNGDNGYVADSLEANKVCEALITDANGCTLYKKVFIPGPEVCCSLTVADIKARVNCYGDYASICAMPKNGTYPYTYKWVDGSGAVVNDTDSCVSLGAGSYTLYVSDANGCADTAAVLILGPDAALSIKVDGYDATCDKDGKDGMATATVNGGTPPYTYAWSNGDTDATADSLEAGKTYTVVVTDANGCKIDGEVKIGKPDCCNLTAGGKIGYDQEGCAPFTPEMLVNIELPSGGIGEIEYLWLKSNVLEPVYGSSNWKPVAGPGANLEDYQPSTITEPGCYYFVRCARRRGCQLFVGESNIVTVCVYGQPVIETTTVVDVTCAGESDGSACVTVSGGKTPYTYVWSKGGSTIDSTASNSDKSCINGLAAGTYNVMVYDSSLMCYADTTVVVNEPQPLFSRLTATNITCNGATDGKICLRSSGGSNDFRYVLYRDGVAIDSTEEDSPCFENLVPGNYRAVIFDAASGPGCFIERSASIEEPAELVLVSEDAGNVTCYGSKDGFISACVDGGTAPYTFTLVSSDTVVMVSDSCARFDGLGAGIYFLTITDANGCEIGPFKYIIFEPAQLEIKAMVLAHTTGCGKCDGKAKVMVTSGGVAPFTYQWNNPSASTNDTVVGLCKGDYMVTVTDANGCTAKASVTIQGTDGLDVDAVSKDETCYQACDGVVMAAVNGDAQTATFTWKDAEGNVVGNTAVVGRLCPGWYYVTVKNEYGCEGNDKVEVKGPSSALSIPDNGGLYVENTCPGACAGSVTVMPQGGTAPYAYSWNVAGANGPTIENLCVGLYTVTVTDKNGCATSAKTYVDDSEVCDGVVDTEVDAVEFNAKPNVFANQTVISFKLNENTNASVEVYDLAGKSINTVFNGNVEAGKVYNVKFDGTRLEAGVYIGKLLSGNKVHTTKLILVK